MGIRYLIVVATIIGICVVSPIRPIFGLYGYYWFGMMRPDILAWAGPNRYSLVLAVVTLLSNIPTILRNLPHAVLNPVLRNLLLFFLVVTISVITAVDPSVCVDRYMLFSRVFLMAFIIPLAITTENQLRWFFVVVAGSLGLLGAKFGLWGVLFGGAIFLQGFGGLLSDNNTMALAFAMAIPLCWFSRLLVPWKSARLGFVAAAVFCAAAVVFTHSRGGILSVGAALLMIVLSERKKLLILAFLVLSCGGIAYLVWDSLTARLSTLENPMDEASARSRIILTLTAPKIWLDYPLFGVGFTETNQQRLLFKYVPPEYSVAYAGRVLHNNWMQILVDSGIFAFLLYVWLLLGVAFRMWSAGRRISKEGNAEQAAIPYAIASALGAFIVGSTFLSRTTFDLFYVLLCTAAAWEIIRQRQQAGNSPAAVTVMSPVPSTQAQATAENGKSAGHAAPAGRLRTGFTRLRSSRLPD